MSFWWFHKVLTLRLFLQVRFNPQQIHLEPSGSWNFRWRGKLLVTAIGSEIISSLSTVLQYLQRQPASPCTSSMSPPAPAMAKAWNFSRTAVALSVCQVLPASSRTDTDQTPHRLVPEHKHGTTLWAAADIESSLRRSVGAIEWHAHPSPAMGDLFRPDLQQLRDLESKHEALASPLQAAAVLLALALEDPFPQRCCLNQSHFQLAIDILMHFRRWTLGRNICCLSSISGTKMQKSK